MPSERSRSSSATLAPDHRTTLRVPATPLQGAAGPRRIVDRISSLTLAGARVRLSSLFELASFSATAAREVLRFQEYAKDPAWAGVLIPRGADWRRVHLVTHESLAALDELRD